MCVLMAKKRRSVATSLDDVDRTMYTSFCSTANSLSQLYSQAMNQQKLAFQAGERHSLEKLYEWMLRRQEDGLKLTTADIIAYLQKELNHDTEEPPPSPRFPFQHQSSLATTTFPNSDAQLFSGSSAPATILQAPRSGHFDNQAKNSVFSSALSSPVRRSLQHYHLDQGGYHQNNVIMLGYGARSDETNSTWNQSRESSSLSSSYSCMEMHTDSPGHDTV